MQVLCCEAEQVAISLFLYYSFLVFDFLFYSWISPWTESIWRSKSFILLITKRISQCHNNEDLTFDVFPRHYECFRIIKSGHFWNLTLLFQTYHPLFLLVFFSQGSFLLYSPFVLHLDKQNWCLMFGTFTVPHLGWLTGLHLDNMFDVLIACNKKKQNTRMDFYYILNHAYDRMWCHCCEKN